MKMKNLVALSALLAIGVVATAAHATSRFVGALSGGAQNPGAAGCFTRVSGNGMLQNTCGSTQRWEIPLPIDSTTVTYSARAYIDTLSLTNGTECRLIASSPTFTGGSFSTFAAPTVTSTFQPVGIGAGLLVPSDGFFFAECDLGPSSAISSVVYF